MRRTIATAALCALAWLLPRPFAQDPVPRPRGPEPVPARVEPQNAPRQIYEGVYELRRRVVSGEEVVDRTGKGYVAVTRRHMFLCLAAPGRDPDVPLLRAGVRSWQQKDTMMQTDVKLGFYTDEGGDVHLEKAGERAVRRVEVARGLLRIHQDDRSYLEFERVE